MAGCVLSYSHQPLFIWVTIVVISYFRKPWEDSISLRPQTLFPWSSTLRRWERALDGKWTIISRCPSLPLVLDPRDYNLPHPPRGFLHPASLAPFSPGYKLDIHTSSASSLRNPRTWAGCLSPALPLGSPLGNPSKYRKGWTEDIIRTLSFFFFSVGWDFNLTLSSALCYDAAMSWSLHSHGRNYFPWHLSFLIPSSSCVCLLTNQSCQSHLSLQGEKYVFDNCIFLQKILFVPNICFPKYVCDTHFCYFKGTHEILQKGVSNPINLNSFLCWKCNMTYLGGSVCNMKLNSRRVL